MIDLETYRFRIGRQNLKSIRNDMCRRNSIRVTAKVFNFKNSLSYRKIVLRCIIVFIILSQINGKDASYSKNVQGHGSQTGKCTVISNLSLIDLRSSKVSDHNF